MVVTSLDQCACMYIALHIVINSSNAIRKVNHASALVAFTTEKWTVASTVTVSYLLFEVMSSVDSTPITAQLHFQSRVIVAAATWTNTGERITAFMSVSQ